MIENAFGILAARWRIFRRPMIAEPNKAVTYTKAAIVLHNYLRTLESSVYCPAGFSDCEDASGNHIEGGWRQDNDTSIGLEPVSHLSSNRCVYFSIIGNS